MTPHKTHNWDLATEIIDGTPDSRKGFAHLVSDLNDEDYTLGKRSRNDSPQ